MKPSDPTSLPWSEERRARLALSHVCEPNLSTLKKIAEQGALMSLDQMRSGQFEADDAYAARGHTLDIDRFVHNLDVLGVRYLVPGDAEWPVGVDDLPGPPIGLFVRGPLSLSEATQRAIGIVGARAASSYGVQVATELAAGVVDRQATVVSGAAFGIDAAAHRGALGANGPTIAVLACGLDRPYPPAHTALIDRIGEVGAIVSEIPPGGAPFASRFLARNRLIATLSLGVVIVEASPRSGSLNTANWARKTLRHVAAVPGPVTAMTSAGCHQLIRETGATLVTDAGEVLELMGRMGLDLEPDRRTPMSPESDLEPRERTVWSAVPVREAITIEDLATRCGESVLGARAMLGRLELLGLVVRDGDRWRKPRARRPPASAQSA